MGVFNWPVRLESMDGERSLDLEAMVDTGASYSIVPAARLRELGVTPIDTISLVMAEGRSVEHDIGEAQASVNGRSIPHARRLRRGRRQSAARGLHARRAETGGGPDASQARSRDHRLGLSPLTNPPLSVGSAVARCRRRRSSSSSWGSRTASNASVAWRQWPSATCDTIRRSCISMSHGSISAARSEVGPDQRIKPAPGGATSEDHSLLRPQQRDAARVPHRRADRVAGDRACAIRLLL